jgi:hypothetical protein
VEGSPGGANFGEQTEVVALGLCCEVESSRKRNDLADEVVSVREPRRLPVVLSPEEIRRLLASIRWVAKLCSKVCTVTVLSIVSAGSFLLSGVFWVQAALVKYRAFIDSGVLGAVEKLKD